MLYIVLILVLAALAGVVTALITANSLWAWISIGLSVLAGIVLFVDWMRRRSTGESPTDEPAADDREAEPEHAAAAEDGEAREVATDTVGVGEKPGTEAVAADGSAEPADAVPTTDGDSPKGEPESAAAVTSTAMLPATGELATDTPEDEAEDATPAEPRTRVEAVPGEEETDAADLLIVSELDAEVVVVDEYPRYHLTDCGWLADRDTIPIEVAEARELGFTPCARCGPDATLAAAHRRKGKSRAER